MEMELLVWLAEKIEVIATVIVAVHEVHHVSILEWVMFKNKAVPHVKRVVASLKPVKGDKTEDLDATPYMSVFMGFRKRK